MVRVNEQSFNNLVNLNLENFYNNLSSQDKGKITQADQMALAELLKKTNEYQNLEQALKILVKCNSNLHDTIVNERVELQQQIISLQNNQRELQDSKMNLVTMFKTSALINQVRPSSTGTLTSPEIHQIECDHSPRERCPENGGAVQPG